MTSSLIHIDGSHGEGGGQIVRSALGLSIATGQAFQLDNIRAGRKKPGLLRQHLTAVRAAQTLSSAQVSGAELGSSSITFEPGALMGGEHHFAVGTAGSALLVFQAVLPGLLSAPEATRLVLEGGTHNPWAPPFDFVERCFVPVLRTMGAEVSVELERSGFYPAGGGRLMVEVKPAPAGLRPIELLERGPITARRATARVAQLPRQIAERELAAVTGSLDFADDECFVETIEDSLGPGNVLLIEYDHDGRSSVFAGFGRIGVSARVVAKEPIEMARRLLKSTAPVDEYLADQLIVPLALAGKGSFRTHTVSRHTTTNIDTVCRFLDLDIEVEVEDRNSHLICFS